MNQKYYTCPGACPGPSDKSCLRSACPHHVPDGRTEVRIFNQSPEPEHSKYTLSEAHPLVARTLLQKKTKDKKRKRKNNSTKELLLVSPRSHEMTTSLYKLISDSNISSFEELDRPQDDNHGIMLAGELWVIEHRTGILSAVIQSTV